MDEDFFILENIHERTNVLVRNDYDRKVVCCRAGISQVVEHENVTECLIVTLQLASLNDEKYKSDSGVQTLSSIVFTFCAFYICTMRLHRNFIFKWKA